MGIIGGGLAILAKSLLYLGGSYLIAIPNEIAAELWERAGLWTAEKVVRSC